MSPSPRDLLPSASSLAAGAVQRVANHLLDGQPWLRERLARFAGSTVELQAAPLAVVLRIAQNGGFEPASNEQTPDVKLVSTPLALARFLAGDEAVRRDLRFVGDGALANALAGVARELRWDAEEDLSRIVGDIPARRLVALGAAIARWPALAARNLAESAAEYWTEERAVVASNASVAQFCQEVDELRDAAERLEKRLERVRAAGSSSS